VTVYLLDTNVFIEAKNRHYGFDFCPAFWEWIDQTNNAEKVFSVEKVLDEIGDVKDELNDWANERTGVFLKPDSQVEASFQVVSDWATSANYEPEAVSDFFGAADYYLVAHAHAHRQTVVTHEVWSDTRKTIKIPNACRALEIECATPFDMLRSEKARFVLPPRTGGGQSKRAGALRSEQTRLGLGSNSQRTA